MADFDQLLVNAIADHFFEPVITGRDYNTHAPIFGPSPMQRIVDQLIQAKRDEIIAAITARLDVAAIADAAAERLLKDIETNPDKFNKITSSDNFLADLQKLMVEKLAQAKVNEIMDLHTMKDFKAILEAQAVPT